LEAILVGYFLRLSKGFACSTHGY